MERLIFIDVDGTLCDLYGTVPKSAIDAIQEARKNGHKVFLCTGRSKGEIYEKILEIGFDGLVCAAGAYVECENKVLFHKSIEDNLTKELVDYLKENKIAFVLESNSGVFIENEDIKVLQKLFASSGLADNNEAEDYMGILKPIGDSSKAFEVNKVLFFNSGIGIAELHERWKEHFIILPNSIGAFGGASGEISDKNINKSTGMQIVLDHYGKTKEIVMAIGDGPNDVEMLEFAQIGIAMGNASKELKQHADEVTNTISENGVYNSFLKHKLI
jgi:Cof subfamily protein (haloacid dehalogenase superfamily)